MTELKDKRWRCCWGFSGRWAVNVHPRRLTGAGDRKLLSSVSVLFQEKSAPMETNASTTILSERTSPISQAAWSSGSRPSSPGPPRDSLDRASLWWRTWQRSWLWDLRMAPARQQRTRGMKMWLSWRPASAPVRDPHARGRHLQTTAAAPRILVWAP